MVALDVATCQHFGGSTLLLLDQTSVLIALETAQAALTSFGASFTAAFSFIGAAWKPEQTRRLLDKAMVGRSKGCDAVPTGHPERISLAVQFGRSVSVVETSIERGTGVRQLQLDAGDKLDAIEYSLHRLIDELSSVMPQLEKPEYTGAVQRPLEDAVDRSALAA